MRRLATHVAALAAEQSSPDLLHDDEALGRKRYRILVYYAREYRDNLAALERIFVATANGRYQSRRLQTSASALGRPPCATRMGSWSALCSCLGGVGSALILVLFVFPAMFSLWRGRGLPAE